jgi:hypothetical protein
MMSRSLIVLMILSAASALTTATPPVLAATVHLSLVADPAAKTWEAYLSIDDPTEETLGLAGIEFDVTAGGGLVIDSSLNRLPLATETSDLVTFFQKGFTLLRSDGVAGSDIRAAQSIFNTQSSTGSGKNSILEGVGESPLVEANGLLPATNVAFPVLVATGTYSGELGILQISGTPSNTTLLPAVLPPVGAPITTFSPPVVVGAVVLFVPEPSTTALCLLGLPGMAYFRRKGTRS